MTPDVTQVKVTPDFFVEADFASGEFRRFDMRPYLDYPAFAALRDFNLFMRAHVAHGVVVWNDEISSSHQVIIIKS